MKLSICLFTTGLTLLLFSCSSEKKVDREIFEQVRQANEVKKLQEVDIISKALEWGEEISIEAQEQLISALTNAIAEKGVPGAIEFCNVEALPVLERVSQKHGVVIRRASNDYRNPKDKPKEDEMPVLEAYEYNVENNLKNEPNVQKTDNGNTLLFTKAIVIPGELCLHCHGEPGKDINEETLDKLSELYPEDKAKGHTIGDLRGMWSIAIPQKEVVKKM